MEPVSGLLHMKLPEEQANWTKRVLRWLSADTDYYSRLLTCTGGNVRLSTVPAKGAPSSHKWTVLLHGYCMQVLALPREVGSLHVGLSKSDLYCR